MPTYPLARRSSLSTLASGAGTVALLSGMTTALSRAALGPAALPLAAGGALLWLGRTVGDAFVELYDDALRVKLGALFDERIPLSNVASVDRTEWPLLGGLGLRTDLKGRIAVVTTAGTTAELAFREPMRLPIVPKVLRIHAKALVVSPEDLEGFLDEVRQRLGS